MKKRKPIRNKYALPLLAFVTRRSLVNFLHISKTGGTALRAGLDMDERDVALTRSHVIHFRQHNVRLADIPHGQKVIFSVRDPVDRFVSAFYSRLRRGRSGTNARQPGEEEAFEQFRTPNELACALSSGRAEEQELARAAMHSIRHVREGLTFWVDSVEELRSRSADILHVCRQETLDRDFAWLKSLLDIPPGRSLPADAFAAHRLPSDFDRSLSSAAAENIAQWYARDFEIIEGCRPFFLDRHIGHQRSSALEHGNGQLTTRQT